MSGERFEESGMSVPGPFICRAGRYFHACPRIDPLHKKNSWYHKGHPLMICPAALSFFYEIYLVAGCDTAFSRKYFHVV